jgi:hypothetical protein
MLRTEILPVWQGRAVSSITRGDCQALVDAIAARPAPSYARYVGALVSRMFRFAVEELDLLDVSPALWLQKRYRQES